MAEKLQIEVEKLAHYIPISHEQLVDDTDHECDASCPPPWTPPPLTRRQRIVTRLRSILWWLRRLPGYRLAHRDDIRRWDDE